MTTHTPAQSMLTDEEIQSIWVEHGLDDEAVEDFARAIETALLSKLRAPVAEERAAQPSPAGNQYHLLKTDPEVFQAVLDGAKTFEIRLNDRGYAVGDVLGLRETKHTGAEMRAGAPLVYTGRECQRFVSHVLTGYGLADGWCCLSFDLPIAGGASAPVAGEAQLAQARLIHGDLRGKWFDIDLSGEYHDYFVENPGYEVRILYAAPLASEAVREQDHQKANAPLFKAARRAVLALAAAAERDPAFQGDYDALSAALSAQPGAQKNGGSDAE